MTLCLNPKCQQPENAEGELHCHSCGSPLLLRGRYRALEKLGQGGFGRAFLAVDEDRLNTHCVIKQLLPHHDDNTSQSEATSEKMIQLFDLEAQQLCKLGQHPRIPNLLAFFKQERYLYLVQEYIEGQTLWHEVEANGALNENQVLQVLMQLLPVLRFVHQSGVIHRDITPTNILRRRRDNKLMLIDFGVAKQLTNTSLAKTGTKVGTQGYAPMEQFRSGKTYPASDIYSLGVTCIYLLTRTSPDRLFDPLKGWTWRDRLQENDVKLDPRLAAILDKMTRDLVRDRYQSAGAVLRDLIALTSRRQAVPNIAKTVASALKRSPNSPKPTAQQSDTATQTPASPPQHSGNRSRSSVPLPPPGQSDSLPPQSQAQPRISSPPQPGWNCTQTLKGHTSWVTSVAISPVTPLLASGSLDDTIRIWNLQTGQVLRVLQGHGKSVNAVALSPDGQHLVSCSDDDTVKVWKFDTGQVRLTLAEHLRDVNDVAFSPDGKTLASGSEDRTIMLWDLQSGALKHTISGAFGMIKAIAISPDGRTLVAGGLDNNVHLWDLTRDRLRQNLMGHFNSITAIAISPDGQIIASGSKDATIKLWRCDSGELIRSLSGYRGEVASIVFTPDGQTVIGASSDKTIKLWRVATGELEATLSNHVGAVNSVAISADGKVLVSGSWDKTIKVWRWFP